MAMAAFCLKQSHEITSTQSTSQTTRAHKNLSGDIMGSVQNVDPLIWTPYWTPVWTPSGPYVDPIWTPIWTPIWNPSGPPSGPTSEPLLDPHLDPVLNPHLDLLFFLPRNTGF